MRPTMLNFRSPKERTGELVYPVTKNDGTHLNLLQRTRRIVAQDNDTDKFTTFTNE